MFCDAKKGDKISTLSFSEGEAVVMNVTYWKEADITVAIVDCKLAVQRHEYYKNAGYGYDHEFIPHITLGKGNQVDKYSELLYKYFPVGEEYIRLY